MSREPAFSPDVLEWDLILKHLSELTFSTAGREGIEALQPMTDPEALGSELGRVTEMRDLLQYDEAVPLGTFADLRPFLKRAEMGAFLRAEELRLLCDFLSMAGSLRRYLEERREKIPFLEPIAGELVPLPGLERAIQDAVDSDGQVKDRASAALQEIRRKLGRKSAEAKRRLESLLRNMVSRGFAQEDNLAIREGRLVLPMKESHRGEIRGVMVDQSSSGATVFIEPLEVMEINNEVRRLKMEEQREIERILVHLTGLVRENRLDIASGFTAAVRLDELHARGRYSVEIGGIAAGIGEKGSLVLKNARHPVLLKKKRRDEVVPLSMEIRPPVRTVVITGPNAGGKTVALKTVGLLALMHQTGLHVPAGQGTEIPWFHHIHADIGDRQSIEQDLSTFSSHISAIKSIVESADDASLVLLDEIGSATDPAEGASLAEAILRHLTGIGAMTVATTHMGQLKVFAHEEEGVENGSMAFDQNTLKPTYRFQMGIPGSSYAFEIAERLGISRSLITAAREALGEERGRLDHLVLNLEQELERARSLRQESEIREKELTGLVKLYRESMETLKREAGERKQRIVSEAEDLLKQSNMEVENLIREIRETQASKEAIQKAKRSMRETREKLETIRRVEPPKEAGPLETGSRVKWAGHAGSGTVLSGPDSRGRLLVQWGDVKIRVAAGELVLLTGTEGKMDKGITTYRVDETIRDEIDLRGMTADEALEVTERYLSNATVAGLHSVRIIHGKGTGVLRREITRYLSRHRLVKSKRLGNWNEGDTGVTIVELK